MQFKNIHPVGDIEISHPDFRLVVVAGAVFDVPEIAAVGIASQPSNYEAHDKEAKALVKQLADVPAEEAAATTDEGIN